MKCVLFLGNPINNYGLLRVTTFEYSEESFFVNAARMSMDELYLFFLLPRIQHIRILLGFSNNPLYFLFQFSFPNNRSFETNRKGLGVRHLIPSSDTDSRVSSTPLNSFPFVENAVQCGK